MAENDLNQKIKQLRASWGLSMKDMAAKLGVAPNTYSEIESGKHSITIRHLQSLIGVSDIDINWFFNQKPNTSTPNGNIHLVDFRASGGFGSLISQPNEDISFPSFSLPILPFSKTYYCIQVQGESMEPTIYANDYVVCHKIDSETNINSGYIHVVVMNDNDVCLKRVVTFRSDPEYYILRSDNVSYQERRVHKSEVLQLFRVDLKLSSNLPNSKERIQEQIDHLQEQVSQIIVTLNKKGKP